MAKRDVYDKLYKTRFPELFFTKLGAGCWMFVYNDGDDYAQTGPQYASKDELLADLERFAQDYGLTPKPSSTLNLNGLNIRREGGSIFIALPPELWRKADMGGVGCKCTVCNADGTKGYWDTLALGKNEDTQSGDRTYTVHYPALHNEVTRKAKAY